MLSDDLVRAAVRSVQAAAEPLPALDLLDEGALDDLSRRALARGVTIEEEHAAAALQLAMDSGAARTILHGDPPPADNVAALAHETARKVRVMR